MCTGVKRGSARPREKTARRLRVDHPGGFTLIELLVTMVVLGIVVALSTKAILPVRKEGQRLKCLIHARHNTQTVSAYAADHRDVFPTPYEPNHRYYGYIELIMNSYWWENYSEMSRESPLLRCPANTPQRNWRGYRGDVDYALSVALYIRAEVMEPTTRPLRRRYSEVARVNRTGDILFASQKTIVFESNVWHEWNGALVQGRRTRVNELLHGGTPGRLSVCFADGHARSLRPSESAGYMEIIYFSIGGHYSGTIHGVRGVDIR